MSVQTVFEIHATEDEPIHAMLREVQTLPTYERELVTARLMVHEGTRRAEAAAASIALRNQEQRRTSLARATRARNRKLGTTNHPNGGL
ncbi:hypothetical protein ACFZA2_01895 [Microbacterium sp. NPDC007973]|uniref:hypothetical protein n=1 Tax=Microbacterium sp. NPDC007973 TaxID=3364182 RepID=UPI0036F0BFE1